MVLYFGDPRGGLALLDGGVTLVGVVHGRLGGPGWQSFVPRVAHLPRFIRPDLGDARVVALLAGLRPRLIVSAFFPRVIPPAVLALAPGLNVHPSDLPRWRGPDPSYWAIRAGDTQTAVCVHVLTDELDAGPILRRQTLAINMRWTGARLADHLEARGALLMAEVVADWLAGQRPVGTPQAGEATWAPIVDPDDLEIDWNQPAELIDRFVRAASPYPGAFTGIDDELLVVLSGQPTTARGFTGLLPGALFVHRGGVEVRCADGAFRLGRLRLGTKRTSGARLARILVT